MESLQMDSLKSIVTLTVNTNLIMVKYLMVPHLLKIIKLRLMVKHVVEIHAPSHGIVIQVSHAEAMRNVKYVHNGTTRDSTINSVDKPMGGQRGEPSVMHALKQRMPLDLVEEMHAWRPVNRPKTVELKCSVVLLTAFAWT
jgi:hypothetical protein